VDWQCASSYQFYCVTMFYGTPWQQYCGNQNPGVLIRVRYIGGALCGQVSRTLPACLVCYNPCLRGKPMGNLDGLASVGTNLVDQLKRVDAALAVLGKLNGGIVHAEPKRAVSASARRRMSLAQKARWARNGTSVQSITPATKRTMSASTRKKIAAFQRARWAKLKAQQKAA
jgi:hypothetical protein